MLQWWNEELELDPAKKFTGNMARKTFATMGLRYIALCFVGVFTILALKV